MVLALRLAGMAAAGVAGWQIGLVLAGSTAGTPAEAEALRYVLVLTLAGAALGLVITPYATVVPLARLWRTARSVAAADLVGAVLGLLVGLLIATLASFPMSLLPDPFGRWLPFGLAVLLGWLGIAIGAARKDEIFRAARGMWASGTRAGAGAGGGGGGGQGATRWRLLLDTSAIIDGRIVDIRACGFVGDQLTVPRFVLDELQLIADAPDPARRRRGRRGLEALRRLQAEGSIEIADVDFPDLRGVDSKLIRLARQRGAAIITTDYNLNRVAALQRVPVLNVNDLAKALRAVVHPGEEIGVDVVEPGRERSQGVGYLEDGTMVVVEGARPLVGTHVECEVTRILPTTGGRLIFARLRVPPDDAVPASELVGGSQGRTGRGEGSAAPTNAPRTALPHSGSEPPAVPGRS
jgi:uncharacterized protein YacL